MSLYHLCCNIPDYVIATSTVCFCLPIDIPCAMDRKQIMFEHIGTWIKLLAWGLFHISCKKQFVTGFWKTDQLVTLGLFHFIGQANSYTHTLYTHSQCHYQACSAGNGTVNAFQFWSQFCRPCKFMTKTMGPIKGTHYMEGIDLKFTPVIVRHLLGPLSMFGSMAGTSWTHSQSKQS